MSSRCPVGQVCLNFFHMILTPIASGRTYCLAYNLGHRGTEKLSDMAKVTQLKAATAGTSTHVSLNSVPGTARDLWSHFVEYSWSQLSNPFRGKHLAFFFFFENQKPIGLLFSASFPGDRLCLNGGWGWWRGGKSRRKGSWIFTKLSQQSSDCLNSLFHKQWDQGGNLPTSIQNSVAFPSKPGQGCVHSSGYFP